MHDSPAEGAIPEDRLHPRPAGGTPSQSVGRDSKQSEEAVMLIRKKWRAGTRNTPELRTRERLNVRLANCSSERRAKLRLILHIL
jgi:hypothetical protein